MMFKVPLCYKTFDQIISIPFDGKLGGRWFRKKKCAEEPEEMAKNLRWFVLMKSQFERAAAQPNGRRRNNDKIRHQISTESLRSKVCARQVSEPD